jgi:hypothetical protein
MLTIIENFLKTRNDSNFSNLYKNRETEKEKIKSNFVYVCFGVEDLYINFLKKIGENPNTKTCYDNYYNKILRENIDKLLNNYKNYMKKFKKNPFPYDKYIFKLYFFDFLHKNPSQLKLMNGLVQDKNYFANFKRELEKLFDDIHNLNFYKNIANNLLVQIFDNMYRSLEGL